MYVWPMLSHHPGDSRATAHGRGQSVPQCPARHVWRDGRVCQRDGGVLEVSCSSLAAPGDGVLGRVPPPGEAGGVLLGGWETRRWWAVGGTSDDTDTDALLTRTPRVKGCRGANAALAGGAGLQFLISNHEQILADTVYRQFEIPLLEALDNYKLITADRLAAYEKALHQQSDKIRRTEADNMKIGRRRKRDLNQFRQALADLQRQVDELDAIKLNYHEEVLESEEEAWDTVLGKVAFVIRSQLDFYEKIAGKASDPILEPLVMSIPDPFDAYGPPKEEGQIFSVLSP